MQNNAGGPGAVEVEARYKRQLADTNRELMELRVKAESMSNAREQELMELQKQFEEELEAKENEFNELTALDEQEWNSTLTQMRDERDSVKEQNEMQKEQIVSLSVTAQELGKDNERLLRELEELRNQLAG